MFVFCQAMPWEAVLQTGYLSAATWAAYRTWNRQEPLVEVPSRMLLQDTDRCKFPSCLPDAVYRKNIIGRPNSRSNSGSGLVLPTSIML